MNTKVQAPAGDQRSQRQSHVNLVYLTFLFLPWIARTPSTTDILTTVVVAGLFVPLNYLYFRSDEYKLLAIGATAMLGIAAAPFFNGHSVFHIYACAMVAFVLPFKRSGTLVVILIAVYISAASYFDRQWFEICIGLVLSVIIWVNSVSDAQRFAEFEQSEREHSLSKRQASLLERERIAGDLHDLLGHTLTAISVKSDLAAKLLDKNPTAARAELKEIQNSARKALGDVRTALDNLSATNLNNELSNAQSIVQTAGIALNKDIAALKLPQTTENALGLVVREAITNIVRHSEASEVHIRLALQTEQPGNSREASNQKVAQLTVNDNGVGFDAAEGKGLQGIRKRVESIGGSVQFISEERPTGMSIICSFPVDAAEHEQST